MQHVVREEAPPVDRDLLAWEAELELAVAGFIVRHLTEHRSPAPSLVADDLARWADGLRGDGQCRLGLSGRRHLAAVS